MKWTLALIAINTIIFVFEILFTNFFFNYLAFIPKYALYMPWMFITSIFLHGDFFHLFFNMLALFFFGSYFENLYGSKRFLTLYFLAGILGNLAYFLYDPNSTIPGVGASGAIYGVMGALAILRPFTIVYVNLLPVPLIAAAVFWLIINLVGIIYPVGNIGYHAHLAGLLVGFYYGYRLKKEGVVYYEYSYQDYF